jgi:hypothetical protein
VPFKYARVLGVFGSEAFDFFKMALEVKLFIVVAVSGECAWDVLGEKGTHNFNKGLIIDNYVAIIGLYSCVGVL